MSTLFSAVGGGIRLRNYRRNVAEAVVESVIKQQEVFRGDVSAPEQQK